MTPLKTDSKDDFSSLSCLRIFDMDAQDARRIADAAFTRLKEARMRSERRSRVSLDRAFKRFIEPALVAAFSVWHLFWAAATVFQLR